MVVSRGPVLGVGDFPQKLSDGSSGSEDDGIHLGMTVHEMERRLIMKTLEGCRGNRTEAATMLAISTRTLRNKLHEYGAMDAYKDSNGQLIDDEELISEEV